MSGARVPAARRGHSGQAAREGRLARLRELLSPCRLCPRSCGADRLRGETGFCGVGLDPVVAAVSVHHGEEPPLSGRCGAGNIFFSGCNLRCVFCQNYPISQMGVGRRVSVDELAEAMLSLERRGVGVVNLVTPSHVAPQAAVAICEARRRGLGLPVVFNTGGYERPEVVRLLGDFVDVWLPDVKYASSRPAAVLSGARDYVRWNAAALEAMVGQVGHFRRTPGGGPRGVIVRHLVLPAGLAGTGRVMARLGTRYGPRLCLSLMFQYFPAHLAAGHPVLGRRLGGGERREALESAAAAGLSRGWMQECSEEEAPCGPGREGHRDSP